MTELRAPDYPAEAVRARARLGVEATMPDAGGYGGTVYGGAAGDLLDGARLVPPVFMPRRLEKLIELGREPLYEDVCLDTRIGGLTAPLPLFVPAFGSTRVASRELAMRVTEQAARLGLPLVIGENLVPTAGLRDERAGILARIAAYAGSVPDGTGGILVQQSTEDADAEVWNRVYTDPATRALLDSGRLGFELKVGQGAKPGLGGMTVLPDDPAAAPPGRFHLQRLGESRVLRSSSPGTFTEEILRQQIRFMRNNFPSARVWVKLPPGRDIGVAVGIAHAAGADAVTVDGAEGGTGWAPSAFLHGVGLPLAECLRRIAGDAGPLLVTGRVWEGLRAAVLLALGADAVGLGRAALIAVDEDPAQGLIRLVEALAFELRLLISAVGKYAPADLESADVWVDTTTADDGAYPMRSLS